MCTLFECVELSVRLVIISRERQWRLCAFCAPVCACVISVITRPLLLRPPPSLPFPALLGKLPLRPGPLHYRGRGRVAVWRLLLSEWPSLVLIYSSLYTRSSGSLLIFTSTGDTGLLTLTITLWFMVMRIGRCTVPYQNDLNNYVC